MNKRQLAKLAAIAGTVATAAPFIMPHIPPEHHALAASLLGLIAILGGGAMQSPLAKKVPQAGSETKKHTMFPPRDGPK